MRVMVKFSFPVDAGNAAIRTGKVEKVFQQMMEDLKPEAAYFHAVNGDRGGFFVVNMQDSSQIADIAERLFFGLNAKNRVGAGHDCRRPAQGLVRRAGYYPALRLSTEPA